MTPLEAIQQHRIGHRQRDLSLAVWVKDDNNLFGGYFDHPTEAATLFPV